jgi:hypothetical protein
MLDTNTITEEERLSGFTEDIADTGTFSLEQLDKYPGELPFALPASDLESSQVIDEVSQLSTSENSVTQTDIENQVQTENEVSLDDSFLESLKADVEASKQRKEAQQGKTDSVTALRQQLEGTSVQETSASLSPTPIASASIDDVNLDEDLLGDIHEVQDIQVLETPSINIDIPPVIPEVKKAVSNFDLPDVPELTTKTIGIRKWLIYSSAATVTIALLGGGVWWKFSGSHHSSDTTATHQPIVVGTAGQDTHTPTNHSTKEHTSEHPTNHSESANQHHSTEQAPLSDKVNNHAVEHPSHAQENNHTVASTSTNHSAKGNSQTHDELNSNVHSSDIAHSTEKAHSQAHQTKSNESNSHNSHSKQPKDNQATSADVKHAVKDEHHSQPSSKVNVASKETHVKETHQKADDHSTKSITHNQAKQTPQQSLVEKHIGTKSNTSHGSNHDTEPNAPKNQKQPYTKEVKITDSKQAVTEQKIDLKPINTKQKSEKSAPNTTGNAPQQETSNPTGNNSGTNGNNKVNAVNNQVSNKVQVPPFDQIRITPKPQFKTPQPSPNGVFTVQVYSSPSREDAEDWVDRLKAKSIANTFITTQNVRGQTFYRVRFGSYSTREEAETAALKLGYSTGWVDRVR